MLGKFDNFAIFIGVWPGQGKRGGIPCPGAHRRECQFAGPARKRLDALLLLCDSVSTRSSAVSLRSDRPQL